MSGLVEQEELPLAKLRGSKIRLKLVIRWQCTFSSSQTRQTVATANTSMYKSLLMRNSSLRAQLRHIPVCTSLDGIPCFEYSTLQLPTASIFTYALHSR